MLRSALPWLISLTGLAALLLFLARTADAPPAGGAVVVAATPEPLASASPAPEAPAPELIRVVVEGPRSSGSFRLANAGERTIGLNAVLQPGWTLTALDSGSATFRTAAGKRRIALSAPPVAEEAPRARTVLVPDAPAKTADGETVSRCTDPEC